MKNRIVEIIVIGAGASGLFLGTELKGRDFLILEKNSKVGSKMLISGGGKCNVTNASVKAKNYLGEARFIQNIIKRFDQDRVLSWLDRRGLSLELRKDNKYFCKNSAKEIVDLLKREIDSKKIVLQTEVKEVKKRDNIFQIYTNRGVFKTKKLVIASGGLSFPKLGASSIGYDIALGFGHTIKNLNPALVGFTLQPDEFFFKSLSGISTEVNIKIGAKEIKGSLLFAHRGVTGLAILNASLYWQKGKIEIDFIPHIDLNSLKNSKKNISNLLGLPNRMAKAFLVKLDIEDKKALYLSSKEWDRLLTLKRYAFAPAGTFGYSKAEVTKGGIETNEIKSSSMMSEKESGLYFLGELLDITGELGGYNFQWAFSTAFVCAKAI